MHPAHLAGLTMTAIAAGLTVWSAWMLYDDWRTAR